MAPESNPVATAAPAERGQTAAAIFSEQVRLLYRLSRPDYVDTLAVAFITTFGLWHVVPRLPLVGWFGLVIVITAARFVAYRQYLNRDPPAQAAGTWATRFVIGAVAMGAAWGALGSLLLPPGEIEYQILIVFAIVAMIASSLVMLTPVRSAFLGFMLPALLPLIVTVFAQGNQVHVLMGAILTAFAAVMLTTSPLMHRTHVTSLRRRFENSELVKRLSAANQLAEDANRQLSDQLEAQKKTEQALQQSSSRLDAVIDASPLAIIVEDQHGVVTSWNEAAERIFGWTAVEVIGRESPAAIADEPDERTRLRAMIQRGEPFTDVEAVRARKDGARIPVSLSAAPLRGADGIRDGLVLLVADISDRKRAELRQNIQNAITALLADAKSVEEVMPEVIHTLCDGLGWVAGARRVVPNQREMPGHGESWCIPVPEIESFMQYSAQRVDPPSDAYGGLLGRVAATGKPVWVSDLSHEPAFARGAPALAAGLRSAFAFPVMVGGEFYGVIELFGREVRPRDNEIVNISTEIGSQIGQFIARKQAESHLTFFANHDALTGLPNRAMFNQRLTQALARAQRFGKMVAIQFVDLDHFKEINDTLGHDAGDRLLKQLAVRLRDCLREGDTVGRQGGDEFVVLIEDVADPSQVTQVVQKIIDTVARPYLLAGKEQKVTASIGISIYPDDGHDQQTLLKNADIAMYRAKEQGRNNFQFYSAEMNLHSFERLALETSLRRAVERREFLLHYQPRVDMKSGRITGVEVLVRWQHPDLGIVLPAQFVPLAQETGLIAPIGEWVLRTACAEARSWTQRGLPPLRVAMNLSALEFARDGLAATVAQVLRETGLDPGLLEFEITESTIMHNADRAADILRQLEQLGVRVAIDDFGTGYSSLSYLKRFPISSVKIDHSFILQIPHDADDSAITRAVIAMAHNLHLKVVAEGVETAEQYHFLQEHHCDEMQGYYYSKPVDAATLALLLGDGRSESKLA
jgi:diguanylate cyclase (GGDEF)-like protein/PAS domain S-box-containing protein